MNFKIARTPTEASETFHFMWSLHVEEQFYLIWPLIIFFFPLKHLGKLCWGILLLSPLIRWGTELWFISHFGTHAGAANATYVLPFTNLDGFMLGAFIALPQSRNAGKWLPILAGLAVGTLTVLGYWNSCLPHPDGFHFHSLGYPLVGHNLDQHLWQYFLFAFPCGYAIWVSVKEKDAILTRFISSNWLRWIGKVSYGLYIWHYLIIYFLKATFFKEMHDFSEKLLFCLLAVILSLLVSWMSYRYFEKYFLDLKRAKIPQSHAPGSDSLDQSAQPSAGPAGI